MTSRSRAWLLVPAGVSLVAGLDAGLLRMGVAAPVSSQALPGVHGPVMVLGFLGTLIGLERAVALRSGWGYAAPVLLGFGGLALVAPFPPLVGRVLLAHGTIALVAVLAALWQRRRDDEASTVVPLLAGFVVLTIAAERVELARIHLPRNAGGVLIALATGYAVAATATLLDPELGSRAVGLALLALVAWLAPHDVARHTVRSPGLPRFSASAMLAGYAWLAVAGIAWSVTGAPTTAAAYDVLVHTIFLGFATSMVIAHAPVILPAVIRRPLPYRPALWLPLVVLHAGLVLRVGGDLAGMVTLARTGGVVTVAALLLLPLTAASSAAVPVRHPESVAP